MNFTKDEIIEKYKNKEQVVYKNLSEELRRDIDIYLLAMKPNKIAFRYALGDDILRNEEIILNAVKTTHFNYMYIPNDLRENIDFNIKLSEKNPLIYNLMSPEMQKNEKIFMQVLSSLSEEEVKKYIKKYFMNNKNILIDILQKGLRIGVSIFSDEIKKDKELLKSIVDIRPEALPYFSKEIIESDEIFEIWLSRNLNHIVYFDYKKENLSLYKQACLKNKGLFTFFPEEVRGNKKLILDLLKNHSDAFFSKIIIEGLGDNLKKDRDVFIELAKSDSVLSFDNLLPKEFYDDIEILKTNLQTKNYISYKSSYMKALHKHEEIALILLEKDILNFKFLSEELINSFDFNKKVLDKHYKYYKNISDEMKKNKEFVRKCATFDYTNFEVTPIEIKQNLPFMMELLSENVGLMEFMLPEIRMSRDILTTYRSFFRNQRYRYPSECDEIKKLEREENLFEILNNEDKIKDIKNIKKKI